MYCHLVMKVCTCHRLQATCHVIHLLARQVIACVTNNFKTLTNHRVHMSDLWRISSKCQTRFKDALRMTLILLSATAYSQTRNILMVWLQVGSCVVLFMWGRYSPMSRIIDICRSFMYFIYNCLIFSILIQIAAGSPRSSMATSPQPPRYAIEKEQTDSQLRKLELENSSLKLENKSLKDKYNRAQCK